MANLTSWASLVNFVRLYRFIYIKYFFFVHKMTYLITRAFFKLWRVTYLPHSPNSKTSRVCYFVDLPNLQTSRVFLFIDSPNSQTWSASTRASGHCSIKIHLLSIFSYLLLSVILVPKVIPLSSFRCT